MLLKLLYELVFEKRQILLHNLGLKKAKTRHACSFALASVLQVEVFLFHVFNFLLSMLIAKGSRLKYPLSVFS